MAFGSGRRAEIQLGASNRKLKQDLRQARGELTRFGKDASSTFKSAFSAAAGGLAGFASIQGVASLGRSVLASEDALERIGIQAGLSGGELDELRQTADATGRRFGMTRREVLEAAAAIIDLEGASGFSADKMNVLAKASVATGAGVKQLAGLAYSLNNAFKVANAAELEEMLSAITSAGKQGSVPLAEMSTVLQQIGTKFARIAPEGKAGAAQLAAAIQVARKGFGSAAEVGTGIKAFVDQLDQAAPKLSAFGVRVFTAGRDGRKQLRPMTEILDQLGESRLIKDPWLMTQVFGSSEARQFINTLVENREQFDELAAAAQHANDVQADSQRYLSSTAGRLRVAVNNARASLEAMVTPERLEKFVALVQNQLVPALDLVLDNAGTIATIFASYKIGGVVKSTWDWVRASGGLQRNMAAAGKAAGAANVASSGLLSTALRLAGPLGIAATAAGGLYLAYKATRKEAEALTEEEIRRAARQGRRLKGASQFDPTGQAAARQQLAKQTRQQVRESNNLLFSENFGARARQKIADNVSQYGFQDPQMQEKVDRAMALREEFISSRGLLSNEKFDELEALLNELGLHEGKLLAGRRGVEGEQRAQRYDAEAAAISAVEQQRFGRADFQAAGLDVGALADQAGLKGAQREAFIRMAIDQLQERGIQGVQVTTEGDITGRVSHTRSELVRSRLEMGDDGRLVRREDRVDLFSLGGLDAIRETLVNKGARERVTAKIAKAAERAESASPGNQELRELLTKTMAMVESLTTGGVKVQIDGREIFTTVANSPEQLRSPAR